MVDHVFADSRLAALYDLQHPFDPRGDFGFYLPLVMSAESVLDVGCGTGLLLHTARERGHTGRLVGLDPASGMLAAARERPHVEWVRGYLGEVTFEHRFDLVIMTGHAFQQLLGDDEVRTFFAAARDALTPAGRLVFETRNPLMRGWEHWKPENGRTFEANGELVRSEHEVQLIEDDRVTFTNTYRGPDWEEVSSSTLRFLGPAELDGFLAEAGLDVAERYGDWDSTPVTERSPEIITVARRAG